VSRRLAGPLALAAVLTVALLVGAGAFGTTAPTAVARVAGLERLVGVPPHSDLSIAQSEAPAAIELRREVAAGVAHGRTDAEILHAITARYGTQLLLEPPAGPLTTVLWAVPVALAVAAVGVAGAAVWRRRRA
jgi:cytochrome c-type biogenesis protein CcmH